MHYYGICLYDKEPATYLNNYDASINIKFPCCEEDVIDRIDNFLFQGFNDANSTVDVFIEDTIKEKVFDFLKEYDFKNLWIY